MRQSLVIRLLVILLTVSFTSEIVAYLQFDEVVSLEVDNDGEPEEEKEEKKNDDIKEIIYPADLNSLTCERDSKKVGEYSLSNWKAPLIDYSTPPPQLG